MRYELMHHVSETFADRSIQDYRAISDEIDRCIERQNLEGFGNFLEEQGQEYDRLYIDHLAQLEEIKAMTDNKIRQLYYATFNRWHPAI